MRPLNKWLLVLAWWFTFTTMDPLTGAVVQQGERGPYDSDIACERRRDHFIAVMQRPRIDARDPKKVKALPPLSLEAAPCDSDQVMGRKPR